MGKKTHSKDAVLTSKECVRHASTRLERHIFQTGSESINQLLENSLPNISFTIYQRGKDLLRETKKEVLAKRKHQNNSESFDFQEVKKKIRKQERLVDPFEQKLEQSNHSYERTYEIFKKISLREKYKHLLGNQEEEEQQKTNGSLLELQKQEEAALKKIKQLYRGYKVSNMYKKNVVNKICRKYVQQLIKKGFIRENNKILSLAC